MKRVTSLLLALVFCVTLCVFCGCSSRRAPKVEEVYDRVVELVEASKTVNTLFYGAGLPVYAKNSEFAETMHLYYDISSFLSDYEIVSDNAMFCSVEQIKEAARAVYSNDYLEKVFFPQAFDGYAVANGMGGMGFVYARYQEDGDWIYQYHEVDNHLSGIRIYDYSTMKIVRPSSANAIFVRMNSWLDSAPEQTLEITLRLVLQDGEWFLDTFTG